MRGYIKVVWRPDSWVRRVPTQICAAPPNAVAPRIGFVEALFACSGWGYVLTAMSHGVEKVLTPCTGVDTMST